MPKLAPILTFNSDIAPWSGLNSVAYSSTGPSGQALPIPPGTSSSEILFRIYNNQGLVANIADALDFAITTFDGCGAKSQTANQPFIYQTWDHMFESGYGQNSSSATPPPFTAYNGTDTAVGGSNVYLIQAGTDGSATPSIKAGPSNSGVGFVEFTSYLKVPSGASGGNITFCIVAEYLWTT